MRTKYFFLITIIFVIAVSGESKTYTRVDSRIDTSNIGLVLKISLQRDTIWLGEPLILTSTLTNKSTKPIDITTFSYYETGLTLFWPSGEHKFYGKGFLYSRVAPWVGKFSTKLSPMDSIYWRELVWLENFGSLESLEDFAPGRYRIKGTFNYDMTSINKDTIRKRIFIHAVRVINRLSDSISFILANRPELIKTIKPIREYLKNYFYWNEASLDEIRREKKDTVSGEVLADYLYQYLLKTKRSNSQFVFYADYLLPTIASLINYRKKSAIILADEFMKNYPDSTLSEEMAFRKGRLIKREWYKKPECDSVMEEWLKPVFQKYPKNAYRFAFELGRNLNDSENKK
jgi:hypothetical protein